MTQAQTWKGTPFTIEREEGKAPGTLIFRFHGPFTARDMFDKLAPTALDRLLSFQPTVSDQPPTLNILDLTEVPYIDSAGLYRIVRHYVHCRRKGVRMIAAGAGSFHLLTQTVFHISTVVSTWFL